MVNGIIDNALFHSSLHINQLLPHVIQILHFFVSDLSLNYAPDFVGWLDSWCLMAFSVQTGMCMIYIVQSRGQTHNKTIHRTEKHIEALFNLVFVEMISTQIDVFRQVFPATHLASTDN